MVPDYRILTGLRVAIKKAKELADQLDAQDRGVEEKADKKAKDDIEAITLDNWRQLLGVKQMGYRA